MMASIKSFREDNTVSAPSQDKSGSNGHPQSSNGSSDENAAEPGAGCIQSRRRAVVLGLVAGVDGRDDDDGTASRRGHYTGEGGRRAVFVVVVVAGYGQRTSGLAGSSRGCE